MKIQAWTFALSLLLVVGLAYLAYDRQQEVSSLEDEVKALEAERAQRGRDDIQVFSRAAMFDMICSDNNRTSFVNLREAMAVVVTSLRLEHPDINGLAYPPATYLEDIRDGWTSLFELCEWL